MKPPVKGLPIQATSKSWLPTGLLLVGCALCAATSGSQATTSAPVRRNSTEWGAEQLLLGGRCGERATCARQQRPEASGEKRPCQCDPSCVQYDDCCRDSVHSVGLTERWQLGRRQLLARRQQWHCHRVNPIFGDVLLKASCSAAWAASGLLPASELELTRHRCEHIRRPASAHTDQLDPIGMMMPITDLATGVTYANSYCLRCNLQPAASLARSSKLLYWSPLLECNYNIDTDDRNQLYDLISSNRGQALQYSTTRNKWLLHVPGGQPASNQTERTCTITPTVPDQVEPMIRYCRAGTIDSCPAAANLTREAERLRLECEFGHQAISFGQTSGLTYFNPACARCHQERQVFCEPKGRKNVLNVASRVVANGSSPTDPLLGGLGSDAARSGGPSSGGQAIAGSFSVLMDLYGSSASGEQDGQPPTTAPQSGALHQCPDATQIYDPFYLTCRDIVCGLNLRYSDGKCVEKFQPAMVYVTTVCLIISILSLTCYLLLYGLSMLDLRHLLVDMAQWDSSQDTKTVKTTTGKGLEGSRDSAHSTSSLGGASSSSGRSQSLSSRGVACLASSLLAAYLLFILGHQPTAPQGIESGSTGCSLLAAATYYCFLLAFNWMFLLAYDVWRTLRLATCQLRGPALHSQARRFLTYTLFAWLSAALIVGLALALDHSPVDCQPEHSATPETNCSSSHSELVALMHLYRPKFGQRAGSCWFSNRRALALFFGLPVALIMLVNLLFFIHSSYMVIKTSSRSSRHLNKSSVTTKSKPAQSEEPRLITVFSSSNSPESNCSCRDYAQQNSLTTSSILTLQSHLSSGCSSSASSSSSEDSASEEQRPPPPPPPRDGAHTEAPKKKRPLDSSKSQSSLTNQSVGGASIAASLAHKYDAHLATLGSVMGSVVKDYRLYCRLSTIMGLTWLTGLMATAVDQSELLWYLFVVLNTLQGLFIFIAFGCKRSKLANLEILLAYLRHRFQRLWQPKSNAAKNLP